MVAPAPARADGGHPPAGRHQPARHRDHQRPLPHGAGHGRVGRARDGRKRLVFIIVVGCGRVGAELAFRLYQRGHQVAVIDQVGSSFANLDPDYRGRTIEGEVLSHDVLVRAGIEEADGLTAVTNSDSVNAVVGHMARDVYKVHNVGVRNYDPRWLPMHEAFGLQVASSTAWAAQSL